MAKKADPLELEYMLTPILALSLGCVKFSPMSEGSHNLWIAFLTTPLQLTNDGELLRVLRRGLHEA